MHLKHGNLNSEYSHHGSECVKNRRKSEKSPHSPKYRARGFLNSFVALPIAINPMLAKRILMLSPIGKKLV